MEEGGALVSHDHRQAAFKVASAQREKERRLFAIQPAGVRLRGDSNNGYGAAACTDAQDLAEATARRPLLSSHRLVDHDARGFGPAVELAPFDQRNPHRPEIPRVDGKRAVTRTLIGDTDAASRPDRRFRLEPYEEGRVIGDRGIGDARAVR